MISCRDKGHLFFYCNHKVTTVRKSVQYRRNVGRCCSTHTQLLVFFLTNHEKPFSLFLPNLVFHTSAKLQLNLPFTLMQKLKKKQKKQQVVTYYNSIMISSPCKLFALNRKRLPLQVTICTLYGMWTIPYYWGTDILN